MTKRSLSGMSIDRAYEVLELSRDASFREALEAYKVLVSVWHPDRFSHSPRLAKRAEEKLKEINSAYETVKRHMETPKMKRNEADGLSMEVLAETGTVLLLKAWKRVCSTIKKLSSDKET